MVERLTTNNKELADRCRMIAAHGQKQKYFHEAVGCNSRLDTIQAAILNVKLTYLDDYITARRNAAAHYYQNLVQTEYRYFALSACLFKAYI